MKQILVTPKAYARIMKDCGHEIHNVLKEHNAELKATHWIYMNLMGGWTDDECDNIAYLVDPESFKIPPMELKGPVLEP